MNEPFSHMLTVGGKFNSLGRVNEVIAAVLADPSRLEELYAAIGHEDPWARMRAIDAFEKISREQPDWIVPYVPRLMADFADSPQASIQWHLAQIFAEVPLTEAQKIAAIDWLTNKLSTTATDWIVAANCLKTLAAFVRSGDADGELLLVAIATQQRHKSPAVVKRATKLLVEFA